MWTYHLSNTSNLFHSKMARLFSKKLLSNHLKIASFWNQVFKNLFFLAETKGFSENPQKVLHYPNLTYEEPKGMWKYEICIFHFTPFDIPTCRVAVIRWKTLPLRAMAKNEWFASLTTSLSLYYTMIVLTVLNKKGDLEILWGKKKGII